MSASEPRVPDLSELYGLVLSTQASTRARFQAILKIQARILARLEERPEADILQELEAIFEQERDAQSDELKSYLRRPQADD